MASDKETNKENEIPLDMILQRSFESIWYQSEVLHKRTSDLVKEKFESQDKRLDALEKWNDTLNETIRDRIMMFSQDIIATLKDMLATLQASHCAAAAYCHDAHFPSASRTQHNLDFDDPGPLDEDLHEQVLQPELLEPDLADEDLQAVPP